jgi:alginate O-acetyltransferase complex protein AlgI
VNLSSLQALLALLTLSVASSFLPDARSRRLLLGVSSAGFLYLLIPNVESWATLVGFLFSGYAVAWALRRGAGLGLLAFYGIALVCAFLIIRKYDFVMAWAPTSLAAHTVVVVGLSYMLFRQIHFLVDCRQGQIEKLSLWKYVNYQISFLTILSGPIQRYQEFEAQWDKLALQLPDPHSLQMNFLRLMIGYVKLALVAPLFLTLHESFLAAFAAEPTSSVTVATNFLGLLYAFPIYLYLNFSGYCDIVISAGYFFGMRLPENFDKPYQSRNVIDFWTRFHRTLGFWIRDYLFLPSYKWIAERWPKKADSLAFLCYFVAFFLAGIWHGPTANFVVYGLLQAVGVSAAKLWERHLIKSRGRAGLREYMKSRRTKTIAIIATLHFECFSLLFFPNSLDTVKNVFHSLFKTLF